jgi:hypothetical protein
MRKYAAIPAGEKKSRPKTRIVPAEGRARTIAILKGRCLAGAVTAEQTVDATFGNVEMQSVYSASLTICLDEGFRVNGVIGHWSSLGWRDEIRDLWFNSSRAVSRSLCRSSAAMRSCEGFNGELPCKWPQATQFLCLQQTRGCSNLGDKGAAAGNCADHAFVADNH